MLFSHLRRGLLVGVVGGIMYGIFTLLITVNLVSFAESLNSGHHEAAETVVSETTTVAVSVGGGILWGVFLGLLGFGAVYFFLEPAIPGARGTKSYLLGAAGFITISGAPWLVLPPLPPGVEQTLPTNTRVVWYIVMIIAGALACGGAGYLYNYFHGRWGRLGVCLVAGSPFLLPIGVAMVAPATPLSGDLSYQFITVYQGIVGFSQCGLWFTLASIHAWAIHWTEPTPEPDMSAELSNPLDT